MTEPTNMWTYWDGSWRHGDFKLAGPKTHGLVFGASVFDGARWFDGVAPDLDRHCARVNASAAALALRPTHDADQILALAREGIAKFSGKSALYIRPTYWAESAGTMGVDSDPESTQFCLCIFESAMPTRGTTLGVSPYRRPTPETAPTQAKSGCLYPQNARAVLEAKGRGFDNALLLDMLGNVAETATNNLFLARDGIVYTPAPNGSFLNGLTRQRVIALLRAHGIEVVEKALTVNDFLDADEVFSTGNNAKVLPISRIETREYVNAPFAQLARRLYWDWARREAI